MGTFLMYYMRIIYKEFRDLVIYLTWTATCCTIVMAQVHDPSSVAFPFLDSNTILLELKSGC